MKKLFFTLLTVILLVTPAALYAFDIQIQYDPDPNNFFNTAERKTALETAVKVFTDGITTTNLSSITPSSGNTWTGSYYNPANMSELKTFDNSTINANTIVVYVGGCDQSQPPEKASLALGGPGSSSSFGTAEWNSTVAYRGRSTSFFSPWGGTMSFDTSTSTSWYFGTGTAVPAGQYDFYSVAIHEMGHVLGIGTSSAWSTKVNTTNSTFSGPYSIAMYGGNPVPTTTKAYDDNAHWAENTMSTVPVTGASQEARMTPTISTGGTRQYFTYLDWAALRDIGWDVAAVPEPGSVVLFLMGFPFAVFLRVFFKMK